MDKKVTMHSESKKGFTLAEVLITLVIIGVIAAMTIPTLMKNTQNQELVTALKKANSTLQQALINMARNNDSSPGDYSFINDANFINELAKVTNVIKKCNTANTTECLGVNVGAAGAYKGLNNSNPSYTGGKSVVLADGQALTYVQIYGSAVGLSADDIANCRGRIILDVNGHKGPNVVGRDVYLLYIVNGKGIVPAGSADISTCDKSHVGESCAARVLRENAMNY